MTIHRALVLGLAVIGAVSTGLLTCRFLPLAEVYRWGNCQSLWIVVGATAGALWGHLVWVLAKPRHRVSRAAAACTLANMVAWLSFLVFTPPLPSAEFGRIAAERVQRDAGAGGLDIIHDKPTIVAGRWHGTFGAVNFADWLLTLFAAEAIGFAQVLMIPSRYPGIDATRGESFAVAGVSFVLSTAFWVAFGGAVTALRRKYGARAAKRLARTA